MLLRVGTLLSSHIGTGEASGAVSGAALLAAGETQALALDFTDDFFEGTTGLFGSAYVLDTGTPANNYNSHPYGLLTYTSPSLKMTIGPDGLLRFGAHNLYLNSATPANQSITVVSGATYAVTITGATSVTASGAATGTWTAGTQTFTAATTTLTFGSTSGAGTVHVRRTPSDSTYLATTSAARYALPHEWDSSGNPLGILVEEARTNVFLNSATGVTQNCTTTAAPWTLSFYGTGTITLTGTSTAGPLVGTGADDRVNLTFTPSAGTLTLTVSGSCTNVQLELGSFPTSYIPTLGSTVTRAADRIELATTSFPWSATTNSFAVTYVPKETGGVNTIIRFVDTIGSNNGLIGSFIGPTRHLRVYNAAGTELAAIDAGTVTVGEETRIAAAVASDNFAASLNGGAVVTDTAGALDDTQANMYLFSSNTHTKRVLIVPRRVSDGDLPTFGAAP